MIPTQLDHGPRQVRADLQAQGEAEFYPVILSDSGTYTVTYVAHGCSTSVSFHIVRSYQRMIFPIGRVHDVVLYPNPAADQAAIEFLKSTSLHK